MIDLDKIIESKFTIELLPYDVQLTIEDCMKEAIRQALELAYERAEIECDDSECMVELDKESIMSVLDEIKD